MHIHVQIPIKIGGVLCKYCDPKKEIKFQKEYITEKKKKIANKLYKDNRVNFIAPADYSDNSKIESIIKSILDKIAISNTLDSFK